MNRRPVLLGALVGVASMMSACLQPLDVGSNFEPISSDLSGDGGPEVDGGFMDWDAGVLCGTACDAEDGGSPSCAGDLTIVDALEWAAFVQRGCVHFSGNLDIRAEAMPIGVMTNEVLQTVSGHLHVVANPTSLTFSELTTVGGNMDIALSNALTSVALPRLATTGGFALIGNPSLATLNLSALAEVRGNLQIDGTALTTLNLPALTTVLGGGFAIVNHPGLTAISLPALQSTVHNFTVSSNPALTSLRLPVLRSVQNTNVSDNAALDTLDAPALATAEVLAVGTNASLTALRLPALRIVTQTMGVSRNPQLPQCQVDAIRLQLATPPANYTATDNDGTPNTCP